MRVRLGEASNLTGGLEETRRGVKSQVPARQTAECELASAFSLWLCVEGLAGRDDCSGFYGVAFPAINLQLRADEHAQAWSRNAIPLRIHIRDVGGSGRGGGPKAEDGEVPHEGNPLAARGGAQHDDIGRRRLGDIEPEGDG